MLGFDARWMGFETIITRCEAGWDLRSTCWAVTDGWFQAVPTYWDAI